MGAVEVVVAQVVGELAAEPFEADLQVAGEGGSPAFVEDRLVQRLDGPVRLRAAGADAADPDAVDGDRAPEAFGPKLLPVIGQYPLEPPAGRAQLPGDAADEP